MSVLHVNVFICSRHDKDLIKDIRREGEDKKKPRQAIPSETKDKRFNRLPFHNRERKFNLLGKMYAVCHLGNDAQIHN